MHRDEDAWPSYTKEVQQGFYKMLQDNGLWIGRAQDNS